MYISTNNNVHQLTLAEQLRDRDLGLAVDLPGVAVPALHGPRRVRLPDTPGSTWPGVVAGCLMLGWLAVD